VVVVAVECAEVWDAQKNLAVNCCGYPAIWLKNRQRGVERGLWWEAGDVSLSVGVWTNDGTELQKWTVRQSGW
jgi:hypothetical protein